MTSSGTASAEPSLDGLPAPTAIEPSRVLVLNDDEQRLVIETIDTVLARFASDDSVPHDALRRLHSLVAYGEEYVNEIDELARVTLRKRRLEGEVRRCNIRIERIEPAVVEAFVEDGDSKRGHAATGATLSLTRRVWAKVVKSGEKVTPDEKAAAAQALEAAGLGDFVRPDFNTNTVSAYFREQINNYDAEQRALPEHKRQPRAAQEFLPEPLAGFIELDDTPHITVRA